jgi:DNA-binding transcriptional MerR regulator
MRNYERFYTIQEVASLTRRSVSMTRTYAAKLGLGKKVLNRGRHFYYTHDDVVKVLLYKTSISKSTKKKLDTKKAEKKKLL